MMNKKMLAALEMCLKAMEGGETLDSVLAGYPAFAAQLRPLLEAAARARAPQRESLPANVLARQRRRGLALAADLRQGKTRWPRLGRFWRPVLTFVCVAAFVLMSSNGLLLASAHSIPGDTLYPLKRSVESTQLQLVSDPNKRQVLERTFSERRVEETRSLISDKRVEEVEFSGTVSFQSAGEWLVSGIPVVITSQTRIETGIVLGDNIEVDGATNSAGDVEAIRLSLSSDLDDDDLQPGLTPTPGSSGESVATGTPAEEASVGSSEAADSPSQSVEASHSSEDGKGQSTSGSHEERSSSENSHSDSRSGGEH